MENLRKYVNVLCSFLISACQSQMTSLVLCIKVDECKSVILIDNGNVLHNYRGCAKEGLLMKRWWRGPGMVRGRCL
jgi:hypothetical protein